MGHRHMAITEEELARINEWQTTSEGLADQSIHALGMCIADIEKAACPRDGFRLIRKSRVKMIEARDKLDRLIEATSLFHAQAAE